MGIESLSDAELLALLLNTGYKGVSSVDLAGEILRNVGGLNGLMKMPLKDIMNIKGVKLAKATQLVGSLELVRRINYGEILNSDVIDRPGRLISWLQSSIGMKEQEFFVVVFLNTKNHVLGYKTVFIGTINGIEIESREVFRQALNVNASKIIMAHNHPSQNVTPSLQDRVTTRKLVQAGALMGVPVIDHLIVSYQDYYSFRENNEL